MNKCYLCGEETPKFEMSVYRLEVGQKPVGLVCPECRNQNDTKEEN